VSITFIGVTFEVTLAVYCESAEVNIVITEVTGLARFIHDVAESSSCNLLKTSSRSFSSFSHVIEKSEDV